MSRRLLALAAGIVLVASGCSLSRASSHTVTETTTVVRTVTTTTSGGASASPCTGDELKATFAMQDGSAGAGQVTYTLTLTDGSSSACTISGLPAVQLFDKSGNELPTHASQEPGSNLPAATLQPGGSIAYDARFSPTVNGQGDSQTGRCQPTAATLRVTAPGGGTVDASVSPPTPVCEQGSLSLRPAQ